MAVAPQWNFVDLAMVDLQEAVVVDFVEDPLQVVAMVDQWKQCTALPQVASTQPVRKLVELMYTVPVIRRIPPAPKDIFLPKRHTPLVAIVVDTGLLPMDHTAPLILVGMVFHLAVLVVVVIQWIVMVLLPLVAHHRSEVLHSNVGGQPVGVAFLQHPVEDINRIKNRQVTLLRMQTDHNRLTVPIRLAVH